MIRAQGRFYCLEGGEGVGKTEQYRRLCAHLGRYGFEVVATREPGGTPNAEEIRALFKQAREEPFPPLAELFLVMAARADHLERLIRPALARGAIVVCDRFVDSTIVYQGIVRGLGRDLVRRLHEQAFGGLEPDLTLVLDLPIAEARSRLDARGGAVADLYDREPDSVHQKIREGFLSLAAASPAHHRVIDAAGKPEEVAARIAAAVDGDLAAAGWPVRALP